MIGSVTDLLYEAGKHLIRVEQKPDGSFTALSACHLRDARAPIVGLLTEIGVIGAMYAGRNPSEALSHLASKGLFAALSRSANPLDLLNWAPTQRQVVSSKSA